MVYCNNWVGFHLLHTLNNNQGPWWKSWLVNGYVTPPPPQVNKGVIAGLIKGDHWSLVIISPDHKAGYFWGGGYVAEGAPVDQP